MNSTRIRTLVVLALVCGLGGWVVLDARQRSGGDPLPVPWTAPLGLVVLAGIVLASAREVRRWVRGRRARMHPLAAARIAVLATASAYVGAVLAGWYTAQALLILPSLVGDRRERFWLATASAAGAVLLAASGLLGRRWCRRPPEEGEDAADRPAVVR